MNRNEGLLIVGAYLFSLLAVLLLFFASAFIPGLLIFTDAKPIEFITGSLVLMAAQAVELSTYFGKEATSRKTTKVSSMMFAILTYAFHFLGAVISFEAVFLDFTEDGGDKVRAALFHTGYVLYLVHGILYMWETVQSKPAVQEKKRIIISVLRLLASIVLVTATVAMYPKRNETFRDSIENLGSMFMVAFFWLDLVLSWNISGR